MEKNKAEGLKKYIYFRTYKNKRRSKKCSSVKKNKKSRLLSQIAIKFASKLIKQKALFISFIYSQKTKLQL